MTADRSPARFLDPWTLVYERTYPHPIERVFEAVSTGEHLDAWFIPTCTVERKLGGACSFTWGGPAGSTEPGSVTVFDPPHRIRYAWRAPDGSDRPFIQFELEATRDGTLLRFTQAFIAGSPNPWRAGLGSGYHLSLDGLRKFLDGAWTRADMDAALAQPEATPEDVHWMPIYGELIRTRWPAQHVRREGDPKCPAVEAYLAALMLRSEAALAALRPHLAEDVVFASAFETAKGPDAVLENVMNPRLASVMSDVYSTEVAGVAETGTARARVRFPKSPLGLTGFDYTFELREGQLMQISPRPTFS
jgi:uncharacterized protein YndB with AHSA1/START domain